MYVAINLVHWCAQPYKLVLWNSFNLMNEQDKRTFCWPPSASPPQPPPFSRANNTMRIERTYGIPHYSKLNKRLSHVDCHRTPRAIIGVGNHRIKLHCPHMYSISFQRHSNVHHWTTYIATNLCYAHFEDGQLYITATHGCVLSPSNLNLTRHTCLCHITPEILAIARLFVCSLEGMIVN